MQVLFYSRVDVSLEDEELPGRVGDAIRCTDGSARHRATVNMAEISIVLEKGNYYDNQKYYIYLLISQANIFWRGFLSNQRMI